MSLTYNPFKAHALAALESNDSAAALKVVNDPIGRDLTGTEVDQPRVWPWFRDQVGNEAAIIVRSAVEQIVAAKPANPATDATAYAFAVNAQSLLTRLDGVGISPCDAELRLALTTIIQVSRDQAAIDAFKKVLHLGYQSHSKALLQRVATVEDFTKARQLYEKLDLIETAKAAELALLQKHGTARNRLENVEAVVDDLTLQQVTDQIAEIRTYPETYTVPGGA